MYTLLWVAQKYFAGYADGSHANHGIYAQRLYYSDVIYTGFDIVAWCKFHYISLLEQDWLHLNVTPGKMIGNVNQITRHKLETVELLNRNTDMHFLLVYSKYLNDIFCHIGLLIQKQQGQNQWSWMTKSPTDPELIDQHIWDFFGVPTEYLFFS